MFGNYYRYVSEPGTAGHGSKTRAYTSPGLCSPGSLSRALRGTPGLKPNQGEEGLRTASIAMG